MKIDDHTTPRNHAPEIIALAKNRSSAGLRLNIQAAKIKHAAAVAAQKSLIKLIRAEIYQTPLSEHPAIREKYKLICEVIDANEQEKHRHITQLRQAVAVAMETETGIPHWFGWHEDQGMNRDGTTNINLGVRSL